MKKIYLLLVIFLVFSGAIFTILYYRFGLSHYLRARSYVESYQGDEKPKVTEDFNGNGENIFNGVLAGISTTLYPGVWVWTNDRLRFFSTDEYSVYSFYDGCSAESSIYKLRESGKAIITRKIYTKINEFHKVGLSGDYVSVLVSADAKKNNTIREIWLNNWWSFMNSDMNTECEK